MTPQQLAHVRDRLRDVQAKISGARDKRAALAKTRELKLTEARQAGGDNVGEMIDTPAFQAAQKAADELREVDSEISRLQGQEAALLTAIGESVPAPNGLGPNVLSDPAAQSLTETPGAWLSSVLGRRRRDIPNLPNATRFAPLPMAAAALTTEEYNSVESTAAIDLFAPDSVARASGIGVIPIESTKTRLPKFTDLPTAAWIPELGAFPKDGPGVTMVEVEPPKVGLVSGLSIEVFDDLSPLALSLIQRNILRAVALEFDRGVLFGNGSGAQPTGIGQTTGILAESGDLTSLGVFIRAAAKLIAVNARPGAIVMNPLDMGNLLELTEFSGATTSRVPLIKGAGALNGFTVDHLPGVRWWLTPAAPQGTALMYDPSTIAAVIRKELDIAVDPFYDFDNGEVGLRVYIRGDVLVGQVDGVCIIDLTP
jgi:capsid protein